MIPSVNLKRAKSAYQIFLIDDEQIVLDVYCSTLMDSGYRNLHSFARAEEAINMLRCLRPDLILTDIHMPDISGSVLTRLVREFDHLESIPIVAITADVRKETADEIFKQGADAVLVKPVTQDELIGQVTAARERAAQEKAKEELRSCR